jgi:DNA-binding transcriptional MocR family regulator
VLKEIYQSKRDAMVGALEEHMPEGVTWTVPGGGFFVANTARRDQYGETDAACGAGGVEYCPVSLVASAVRVRTPSGSLSV